MTEIYILIGIFLISTYALLKKKIRKKLNKKTIFYSALILFSVHILDMITTFICIDKSGIEIESNLIIKFLFGYIGYFYIPFFSFFVIFLIFIFLIFLNIISIWFKLNVKKVLILSSIGLAVLGIIFIVLHNMGVCEIW